MNGESGTIELAEGGEFSSWELAGDLREPTLNEVRFSLGFLRAKPGFWFQTIGADWLPLFHALGVDVSVTGYRAGFEFPSDLERVTPVEVDGEIAVMGYNSQAEQLICDAVAKGAGFVAQDLLLEYFERRFVSTISNNWSGSEKMQCWYIPPEEAEAAEVVGVIAIDFQVNGQDGTIWFGVGPRMIEVLDTHWRSHLVQSASEEGEGAFSTLSFQLAELAVPPAELIDYMRAGAIINVGQPLRDTVSLLLNGKSFARGELCQFNGRFAAQIVDLSVSPRTGNDATTVVSVEIARTGTDLRAASELSQIGAYVVSGEEVRPTASLVIGGETVATALVGSLNGQLALNILPK